MPYQLDYIRTNHNNQVMPGDRPTMNQAIDSQSPAHVTVLQYGIGVFDLGVQVGSWEPKEHDAGVNKSLVEDQLAEIAVEQTQRDDLTQFLSWVEKNRVDWDSPTRFSRVDIEGFMQYLAAHGMSGVTRVRTLAAAFSRVKRNS